jgi:hypothetical protein
MKGLKCVKTFNTRLEAEVAKGRLQAEKIQAIITADDAGATASYPFNGTFGRPQLLVKEKDLERAQALLATS